MTDLHLDHIEVSDALTYLKTLPDACVNLCVTSPPYFGLRSYLPDGHADKAQEVGTEDTPAAYIARLIDVFREVKRVLRDDGNCYVNLGDSYASSPRGNTTVENFERLGWTPEHAERALSDYRMDKTKLGYPPKSLMLIPHRFAIAMQDAGWILREDIVWQKPSCMPESVQDRCTRSHEYIFHFVKQPRYFYDAQAVAEPVAESSKERARYGWRGVHDDKSNGSRTGSSFRRMAEEGFTAALLVPANGLRNRRSVWTINPASFKDAHFATFPEAIPEICIKAGCPEGGVVLDPFAGAGTVALVAKRLNRRYVGCDLNAEYVEMARRRIDSIPYTLFSLMEATGD